MMIKKIIFLFISALIILTISGCKNKDENILEIVNPRNDVYYELLVRSFADSNEDGIGDFNGITEKLDYFTELGVTGLWLMPIHPSTSYHGYDVTDFYGVNEDYGSIDDFKNLLIESEIRGIKIMLDMVFNHTSEKHPWFIQALNNDEKYRDYYVFADESTNRSLTGSWGQGIWHGVEGDYYCGYFSNTMPDLNLFNEEVKNEIYNISKFWIDLGVDGFRLDAAQHFYGTNEYQNEDYDYFENIIFLQTLRNKLREYDEEFYLIGEISENAESIVGQYFKSIDSPLDFPVSTKLAKAINSYGSSTYVTSIRNIYRNYATKATNFISAPFIFNHDQDRLASVVNGDIDKMKLGAEMLLTLPGSPIIYYGEEVGMFGFKSSGQESNGVDIWDETRRLPLPFGDKYTTTWFNDEKFQSVVDNKNIDTVNVQMEDPSSLWSTYKRILKARNENIALKYGNYFEPYENNTNKIQGFYREYRYEDNYQRLLVIHNLSREELSMIEHNGKIIYVSGLEDYTNVTTIKGKSTIIIDVTGELND